jgi:hypothetical protein
MKIIALLVVIALIVLFLSWKSRTETLDIPNDVMLSPGDTATTEILNAWQPDPNIQGKYTFQPLINFH